MGDVKLVDSMMLDGLIDAFHDYHMGITGKKNGQRYKWDIKIFHMEDNNICVCILFFKNKTTGCWKLTN